jgi:DNA-binding IclR family transcriptional regulator
MKPASGIGVLEKTMRVLNVLAGEPRPWGVRELSRHLELNPSTVLRILDVLEAHAYVAQDPVTRRYQLGNVFYRFFSTLTQMNSLTTLSESAMLRLREATGETIYLNVLRGEERVCIASMRSPQPLCAVIPVGCCTPLHLGASATCLLAFARDDFREAYLQKLQRGEVASLSVSDVCHLRRELDQIVATGFAMISGQLTQGYSAISAPVFNRKSTVEASLTLGIPDVRFADMTHRERCIVELRRTAAELSAALGYPKTNPWDATSATKTNALAAVHELAVGESH